LRATRNAHVLRRAIDDYWHTAPLRLGNGLPQIDRLTAHEAGGDKEKAGHVRVGQRRADILCRALLSASGEDRRCAGQSDILFDRMSVVYHKARRNNDAIGHPLRVGQGGDAGLIHPRHGGSD
jgi:hypothetical protein